MLKKSSAGLLRFPLAIGLAGVCLAAWGTGVFAQDVPVAPTAAGEPEIPFQAKVAQRIEPLKSLDLDALRKAQAESTQSARDLAAKAPELRRAARDAYEEARLNSEAAKEIQKQRAELDQKLDQTLRDLPEVKDKLAEVQQVEQALLVELQVRTALAGLIAAREKEAAESAPK